VSVLIAASASRSCLGDGEETFAALLEGAGGAGPLRFHDPVRLNVTRAYQIAEEIVDEGEEERLFRASGWLSDCVAEALARSGVDAGRRRVVALVGTGLRELRAVERSAFEPIELGAERLHFAAAVRRAAPEVGRVLTLSNACSAGGHALALAQDLIELGEADAVVVAGVDALTESMLAMIGRVTDAPAARLSPFDADRSGTLLGEGAAAFVVVPEGAAERPLARLLGTGLSCDAGRETAPDREGIRRAVDDAFARAARRPGEVDLVVAHGTGTALNDALEAGLIRRLSAGAPGPWITAIKGAIGHTSGASALASVDVAIRCLRSGRVPPIVGLGRPLAEAEGLRLVVGGPVEADLRLAQVDAFGFGGVNAVTLLEAAG
jgi:3-oxoacyl-[acyl-carrier-protein] synthase II